jgi:hypothetical protein
VYFPVGTYTITVGAGAPTSSGGLPQGLTGQVGKDSVITGPAGFTALTAKGGGGGGADDTRYNRG